MKKVCLLSGMMILNVVASLTAMERPMPWQALDVATNKPKGEVDWSSIFKTLELYGNTGDLANEYRDPEHREPLLELAVREERLSAIGTLLHKYHADPNDRILGLVRWRLQVIKKMVELFKEYGGVEL